MAITGMSVLRCGCRKLTEEVGEVAEAFLGVHGLNNEEGHLPVP
jgi:hypothetical protein